MSVAGNWKLTMNTPFGVQTPLLTITNENDSYSGTLASPNGSAPLEGVKVDGASVKFSAKVPTPMGNFPVSFTAKVDGNTIKGTYSTVVGDTEFSGVRQ
jgi:hypothetical protein